MSGSALERISTELVKRGRPADTLTAVIAAGGTPQQQVSSAAGRFSPAALDQVVLGLAWQRCRVA